MAPLPFGVFEAAGEALAFPFAAVLLGETFDFGVALALTGDFCAALAGVALTAAFGVACFFGAGATFLMGLAATFLGAATALGAAVLGAVSFLAFFSGG